MAHEFTRIDVTHVPDLRKVAEAVQRSGMPYVLTRDDQELAVVMPPPTRQAGADKQPRARKQRRTFTRDDALFGLIGIGTGRTPGGVSGDKHAALDTVSKPRLNRSSTTDGR